MKRIFPADTLCDARLCRAYDGRSALYWDEIHVSVEGAEVLAPAYSSLIGAADTHAVP